MHGRRLGPAAGLLLLLALTAFAARPTAAQESCQSAQCHATLTQGSVVHEAAESCDNCHEATAAEHPQKGVKTFKLNESEPALCVNCHDGLGGKAQVHEPFADGSCTTCHSPHASNQARLLLKQQKELCSDCHSEPGEVAHPHGPVEAGDCTACHAPHSSDNQPLLAGKGDALCTECHSDVADLLKAKKVQHAALDDGCTSCHRPHGGANPKLLAEAGQALCFQCHDDIAAKIQNSPVAHEVLASAKGCASCHSPHAADQKGLLVESEKDTCLGCHDEVITKEMTVLHGPIRDGSCTECHDPHGAREAKLLKESFPATAYVPYSDTAYALCFSCHERDLLKYPDTSFATGFRDGERNLHFLHVNNAQKGRSCALCHNLHGAANDALIADSVAFGNWKLPLKFVKTDNGGSCSPGCHRPAAYDRKSAAKKP
jgi:predicted CXXCH cytochrome family protein